MRNFMENNGQMVVMFTLLFSSMIALVACSTFLPKPYDMIVGGALYFSIIIGGFGGGMIYTRERYNKYPHRELEVFPSKNNISLFIAHQVNRLKDNGRNNSALIDLAFERYFPESQTSSKRVIINYKGVWQQRTHGDPSDIEINGFTVPHPNSDRLIVRYVGISLEFQEVVPVYELLMGSTDIVPQHDTTGIEVPDMPNEKDLAKEKSSSLASKLVKAYTYIKSQSYKLDEMTRNATEWQTLAVGQKETIRQQTAEIRGLLSGNSSIKERALEWLLAIYSGQGSIGKTIKALRAKEEGENNKWMMYVAIVAVVGIIATFLYFRPDVIRGIQSTLNNPWVIVAVAVVCIVAIVAFLKLYRPNDPVAKGGKRRK